MLDSNMNNRNCKTCGKFMPNTRIYLGYKECTRCSSVEPYSAHIVYPHKTGGYVQPVDKDTKKHLQTLDRRAVKVGRKSSGGSNSWDRWLKEYKQKKRVSYKGNTSAFQADAVGSIPSTRSTSSVKLEALDIYKERGYQKAVSEVDNMYSTGSISLIQKSNINSFLAGIAVMNKKEQRLILNALSRRQ